MCDNGAWVRYSDYVSLKAESEQLAKERNALARSNARMQADRALAERAGGVKIKSLEWTELSTGWIAHTSFHAYEVVKTDHGFIATYANRDFAWGTEDAMKAAAQADFERRILSAFGAASTAPKVTEAMVEAAAIAISGGRKDLWDGFDLFKRASFRTRAMHALKAAVEAGR